MAIRFKIITDENGRTRWLRVGDFELESLPEPEPVPVPVPEPVPVPATIV